METAWGRQGGGMGVLPCGSYNYLVLFNLPRNYCTCQMCLLDRLHSRVRLWHRRRDSSPSGPKGPFSSLIRLPLAHSSLAKLWVEHSFDLFSLTGGPGRATVAQSIAYRVMRTT